MTAQPTFRTKAETNEKVRSLFRRMGARLDRRLAMADLLDAVVDVALQHEDEIAEALGG